MAENGKPAPDRALGMERHHEPLAPRHVFTRRLLTYGLVSALLIGSFLLIGVIGYHVLGRLSWIDSLLNASMILSGMGPVDPLPTPGAKVFASLYALASGVAFLTSAGILFAPIVHRVFHVFSHPSAKRESKGTNP